MELTQRLAHFRGSKEGSPPHAPNGGTAPASSAAAIAKSESAYGASMGGSHDQGPLMKDVQNVSTPLPEVPPSMTHKL